MRGCKVVRFDLCLEDGIRMLISRLRVLNGSGSNAPKGGAHDESESESQ